MEKTANDKKYWNFGIVGCGIISDTHAKAVSALTNCNLAVSCTRNPERLKQFCNTHSSARYTIYEEFQTSTSTVSSQERKIELNGKKDALVLQEDKLTLKTDSKNVDLSASNGAAGASDPLDGLSYMNHLKQYKELVKAISKDKEPVVSGRDSLKSLAMVEAIYKSAKISRPIFLDSSPLKIK